MIGRVSVEQRQAARLGLDQHVGGDDGGSLVPVPGNEAEVPVNELDKIIDEIKAVLHEILACATGTATKPAEDVHTQIESVGSQPPETPATLG